MFPLQVQPAGILACCKGTIGLGDYFGNNDFDIRFKTGVGIGYVAVMTDHNDTMIRCLLRGNEAEVYSLRLPKDAPLPPGVWI
jgi:hypothetical protein